jgi:lysophospholipase L1-like esterase
MAQIVDTAPSPPAPTSVLQQRVGTRQYRVVDILVLVVAFLVASVGVNWAALGIWPLAGSGVLWTVGLVIIVGAHTCLGALLVGTWIEVRHPNWSSLRGLDHLLMFVVLVAMAVANLFFIWWLWDTTSSWVRFAYPLLSLAAAVGGGLWAWTRLWPGRQTPTPDGASPGFLMLSGVMGFGAGVVVCLLAVVGFAYFRQHVSSPPTSPPRAAPAPPVKGTYVALGDSYSAGEGLPPYIPPSASTGCNRSHQAYSQLLVFTGPPPPRTFSACSGGVIADVYNRRATTSYVAPQVDAGVHPEVGLVTLTIGGNDAMFTDVITACFEQSNCLTHSFPAPSDGLGPAGVTPGPLAASWVPRAALQIGKHDATLFAKLRTTYPNARIVVIGYPYLFPGNPAGLQPNDCASILRRFSLSERRGIRAMQDHFSDLTYEEAVAAHIEYVSPNAIWAGHEPCGPKGQYVNSLKPFLSFKNPIDGGSFHPNHEGQQALARLVTCYLTSYPQPPVPFATGPTGSAITVPSDRLASPASLGLVDPPGQDSLPPTCQ